MATSSEISVGLAHEFIITACKAGFEVADFTALTRSEEKLRQLLLVVRGQVDVTQIGHVIDCDAEALPPYEGWQVEEHKQGGQFTWDPSRVGFYLSDLQKSGASIEGNNLRRELAQKPVLNANVLDYLFGHPYLIPEQWKFNEQGNTRYIYFWGTIYRDPDDYLYVRSLYCHRQSQRWTTSGRWLDGSWNVRGAAALLVPEA